MEIRTIQGLTKEQFLAKCIEFADTKNPNWEQDYFNVSNFIPTTIWNSPGSTAGLSLSTVGAKFFEQVLELTPYYIEVKLLYSGDLIKLARKMPWPYTAGRFEGALYTKVGIYSREVAVWAALYDNDLDKLLEAYSRE